MAGEKFYLSDDIGYVELINNVGTELDIVNAARVSLHKESDWDHTDTSKSGGVLTEKDKGLLNFLMKNKHGTPFEMGFIATFRLRMPIFVAREHVRHRIHSINEESGRYVELRDDWYVPENVREQKGKPGAYTFENTKNKALEEEFKNLIEINSRVSYRYYKEMLDKGVAKEQARMFLPLNWYTEMLWTVNARSLMNYLSLRNHPDAQKEIRDYATLMEIIFQQYMPNVHYYWDYNGREAP
jgi:thymidylate synthase (FAD)